jgi:hypothetical protein
MYPTNPLALRNTVALAAIKGTTGTITKGQAVYVTGFDAVKLALKVEPARSNATGTMEAIGLASTTFNNATTGKVLVQGELEGVDTSGFTLSASLYVSSTTAGAIVSVPPVGPNLRQALGTVTRVSAVDGRILVLSRGTEAFSDAAASPLGIAALSGTAALASRSDHVHAHGDQEGGSLHALVTTSVAGFMSAADKVKLDATTSTTSLSSTLWVDAGTTVAALEQDGSTERPYSTVTAAVAVANASATTAWHFIVEFGDYSSEAQVTIPQNRNYVFEGAAKIGAVMVLPSFLWQPSGNLTSALVFRTAVVGKVEIEDGIGGPTTSAFLVYDQCEARGVEQISGTGSVRVTVNGRTATVFTSAAFLLDQVAASVTQPVVLSVGALLLAYCQASAALTAPQLAADSCTFDADITVTGSTAELRSSGWLQNGLAVTFTTPPGLLLLDSMTDASFQNSDVVLTGSSAPRLTDEVYDLSIYLPEPQDIRTGESTRVTQTTFDGAVFSIGRWIRFSQVYVRLTAQSGGATTLVVAFYQRHDRHSENPQTLVGTGSLTTSSGGVSTVLIPMTGFVELGPGPVWCLYGKVAGGGNATVRTYSTGPADFLNDPAVVPVTAYPTSFTTNISVTTSPPSTLDPTPVGGVVTPSGSANIPLMFRTSP